MNGIVVQRLFTKICPSCRGERDYCKTVILRGLDAFFKNKVAIDPEPAQDDRHA